MPALKPSAPHRGLMCQTCRVPEHRLEINGPLLEDTGQVEFICPECLEPVPPPEAEAA